MKKIIINQNKIYGDVAKYFSSTLISQGITPLGVGWNGEESQIKRFEQLCKIINTTSSFSINDLGCGYGALFDFLAERYNSFSYMGFDVSERMIQTASLRYKNEGQVKFFISAKPEQIADYGVASGIFNLSFGCSVVEWFIHLETTLDTLNDTSRFGFVFNCLTSYSDVEKMRDDLYYADPCQLFDLCKRRYSKNVALLHDYGLYDFTILVRKENNL